MTDSLLNTQSEIIESLKQTLPPGTVVTGETNVVRDLNLDSLAVMDFMFSLEGLFNVTISLDVLADVQTIRELAAAVDGLRIQQGQSASV